MIQLIATILKKHFLIRARAYKGKFCFERERSTGLIAVVSLSFCLSSAFAATYGPRPLEQALQSKDKNERLQAMAGVETGQTKAGEKQMLRLRDQEKDPNVRFRINRAMVGAEMGDVAMSLVQSLEKDPDASVRQGAGQMLGNYTQTAGVVEALAKALTSDANNGVRYACALSLGLSNSSAALDALEAAASDSDADLRRQVAFSLKRSKAKKAKSILNRLKKDHDASVREMARTPL